MIVHDSWCPKFNTAQVDWTHIWWWLGGQFHDAKGSRFEKADGSVEANSKTHPMDRWGLTRSLTESKYEPNCLRSVHAQDEPWWSTNPLQTSPTNYGQLKWKIPRWSLILVSISASSTVGLGLSGSCDRSSCRGLSAGNQGTNSDYWGLADQLNWSGMQD